MNPVSGLFLFVSVFALPSLAGAFPGDELKDYLKAYGSPANLERNLPENLKGDKIQYYWQDVAIDLNLNDRNVKGNLVVLFEKRRKEFVSLQETILSEVSAADFSALLDKMKVQWETISKTPNQNRQGSYDLYRMVSKNKKYSAEMSYSLLAATRPNPYPGKLAQAPRFNFWIHFDSLSSDSLPSP
jgi:hypothetical protein